jgi:flavin reductase (DIM6/NTAB) family NADH-FMN oxidoreductase RutF
MPCPEGRADLAKTVDEVEFRQAMGHFVTGVTVITAVDQAGQPVGTTANAVSALSLEPPLVLVCFDHASVTLQALRRHGAFAVNMLTAAQRQLSVNFARSGTAADWEGVSHWPGITGSPQLHGALAVIECTVEHELPGGDHAIVIGRVRVAHTAEPGVRPLVYWRGGYEVLAGSDVA